MQFCGGGPRHWQRSSGPAVGSTASRSSHCARLSTPQRQCGGVESAACVPPPLLLLLLLLTVCAAALTTSTHGVAPSLASRLPPFSCGRRLAAAAPCSGPRSWPNAAFRWHAQRGSRYYCTNVSAGSAAALQHKRRSVSQQAGAVTQERSQIGPSLVGRRNPHHDTPPTGAELLFAQQTRADAPTLSVRDSGACRDSRPRLSDAQNWCRATQLGEPSLSGDSPDR